VVLLLQGCVGPGRGFYEPNPDAFPVDPIIEFLAFKDIALVNGQVSAENVIVADMGWYRPCCPFFAHPQAWTDTAIGILQRELNNRLTRVVKGAEKKLILSVESVSAKRMRRSRTSSWRFVVYMKAETGDGYVKMFVGDARGGASQAADSALIRAVSEVLKDYEIWKYRQE
jgi:hypothetical protein